MNLKLYRPHIGRIRATCVVLFFFFYRVSWSLMFCNLWSNLSSCVQWFIPPAWFYAIQKRAVYMHNITRLVSWIACWVASVWIKHIFQDSHARFVIYVCRQIQINEIAFILPSCIGRAQPYIYGRTVDVESVVFALLSRQLTFIWTG